MPSVQSKQKITNIKGEIDYARFFAALPVPCLVLDFGGVIKAANRAAARMLRCEVAELVGRPLDSLVAPSQRDLVGLALRGLIEKGDPGTLSTCLFYGAWGPALVRWHVTTAREFRECYLVAEPQTLVGEDDSEEPASEGLMGASRAHDALHQLAAASVVLNSARTREEVLTIVTEKAREVIGAHLASTCLYTDDSGIPTAQYVALSEKYAAWQGYTEPLTGQGIYQMINQTNRPMRLTQEELVAHMGWRGFGHHAAEHPPLRGWLAAPLIQRDGRNLGLVQLSDKFAGDFTEQDEAILVRLAQMASVAVENVRLLESERRRVGELARANTLISLLGQAATRIEVASDFGGVLHTMGNELAQLDLSCMVALFAPDSRLLVIRYSSLSAEARSLAERLTGLKMEGFRIRRERYPYYPLVIEQRQPLFVADALLPTMLPGYPIPVTERVGSLLGEAVMHRAMHLPLAVDARVVGLFIVWGEGLECADLPAFSFFARQVTSALERARLLEDVQRLASVDELTGLYNRRHFFTLARRAFAQARLSGGNVAAVMLDIDFFKQVNDTYGHAIGDQALQAVAQRCSNNIRDHDLVARYGGEEFAILLQDTDLPTALGAAERLRRCVAEAPINTSVGPLWLTMSVGVAELTPETEDVNALLSQADVALYMAKEAGRNRVCVLPRP